MSAIKARTPKMPKPVEREAWGSQQHHRLRATYEVAGYRVRISIRADASYPKQSTATISVWRPDHRDWSRLASASGTEPKWPRVQYTPTDTAALAEIERLLWGRGMWTLGVTNSTSTKARS